jgi:hypothetical protein
MARLFIILMLLCIAKKAQACDCKHFQHKEAFRLNYSLSSHIFIADVIAWREETGEFTMRVEEMLKGRMDFRNIHGRLMEFCSVRTDEGRWIIYANFDKDGNILIDGCGISRPLDSPYQTFVIDYPIPVPPPSYDHPEYATIMKRSLEDWNKTKAQAVKDLEWELRQLRGRR